MAWFNRRPGNKSKIDEIIIHAGLHKTGTTSIQETLFANAERLKERGFLYPSCWPSNHSIPLYGAFTSNKAFFENIVEGCSKRDIRNRNKRFLEVFKQEVAETGRRKIVLSGENISLLTYNELKRVRRFLRKAIGGGAAIKVLISVRHPVPWLVSAAQQRLKAGQQLRQVLDEKMPAIVQRLFRTRVGNMIRVFGRDAVEVYRFEDAVDHRFGPVGDFLERLGFSGEEIPRFHILRANESISLIAADLLAFINEKCPIMIHNRRNGRRTREDIDPILTIRGPKFDIPAAYKRRFAELAQADRSWLSATFGIDFPDEAPSQLTDPQLTFGPETVADLNLAYDRLSVTLKELVAEYLRARLQDRITDYPFSFL